MGKALIDARRALEDIRSGMDDLSLMRKYNLSVEGLQSMFRKLGDAGVLKHINARALVRDLRKGLTDTQLMEKYELSHRGLRSLLDQMERAGIVDEVSKPDSVVSTRILVPVAQIVQDIRSRMGRDELMEKYHLKPRGLRWVTMMLVSSGAIGWHEIVGSICTRFDELVPESVRACKRYKVDCETHVYVIHKPGLEGMIRDISHKGLSVSGIKAKVGETVTLVIGADPFGEYATFALDAMCRWLAKDTTGDYVAGFEISNISVGSAGELQLLIRLVELSQPS